MLVAGNQYQWRQLTDLTLVNAENKPAGRWGGTMTRVTAHQVDTLTANHVWSCAVNAATIGPVKVTPLLK